MSHGGQGAKWVARGGFQAGLEVCLYPQRIGGLFGRWPWDAMTSVTLWAGFSSPCNPFILSKRSSTKTQRASQANAAYPMSGHVLSSLPESGPSSRARVQEDVGALFCPSPVLGLFLQ